ncbi:MAG TPA: hypothetical protein VGI92_08430 [Gemmatimonadales bacterium]|jgi:hypothetical protein
MTRSKAELAAEPDEELFEAYVGCGWSHYRRGFALISRRAPFGAWNWAAALVPFWLAYRKMFGLQIIAAMGYAGLSSMAATRFRGLGVGQAELAAHVVSCALVALAGGLLGDYLVYWQARRATRKAATTSFSRRQVLALLRTRGNVSLGRAAFVSLLALLVLRVAI